MTPNQRYGSQNKTNQLVKLSVFVALIIIQSWVPMLGNIPTPVLSITYIHVTVILATLWLGWKGRLGWDGLGIKFLDSCPNCTCVTH